MISTLLLLGATGDLARRYLFPALGALHRAGWLPDDMRVVGAADTELDDEGIRRLAGAALPEEMLTYRPVDLADPSTLAAAVGGEADPIAVYLALPSALFVRTAESLRKVGLSSGSRVVVEKPFGDDADSARALNALLGETGNDVYRVDHVLGMTTTQNLVAMRRQNPVLDQLWDGHRVEQVEVLWEETLALEGRAGYYDRAGALKDVVQNHMLQLLALVAMDVPADDHSLRQRKLDVLTSVRVAKNSRRARYTSGTLADGREVCAYAEEEGVDPARCTETFAEVVIELDAPRWSGTRFVLRAGKALACRRKLLRLDFRGGGQLEVGIDGPEDVILRVCGAATDPLELRTPAPGDGLPAYTHVLQDVLSGGHELSVGGDEAEEAWRVLAPVLAEWQAGDVPLEQYPAGSAGPP